MMEHATDRLFWTLTSIIIGALILTIGMRAFPKVSEGVFGQMSGVVKQADTANGHVNDAVNQALNNTNSTKAEQDPSANKTTQTTLNAQSNKNTNNTSQNTTNNTNTSTSSNNPTQNTANPNSASSNSQTNTNNNTASQSGISQQHQYPVSVPQSSVNNINDLYNQSLNNNQNH